ncbi:MAG: hypothetical protein LBT79_03465 [Elusimicrobiota bacterium]|nr:hypothetical protein [Elusimicrobiota bacterium]
MSNIAILQKALLESNSIIAKTEQNIKNNPNDFALQLSIQSLQNRKSQLEEEFKKESEKIGQDILYYRIFSDDRINVSAINDVVNNFQKLLTIVFDVVDTKMPKKLATWTTKAKENTALGFGYAYSGSIGLALTLPNKRDLADKTLDEAIKNTFELMNISIKEEVEEKMKAFGSGVIKVFDDWVDSHIENNVSAEIKCAKLIRNIQVPNLKYVKDILKITPIVEEEEIKIIGNLVGIDMDKRTFHITTQEDSIIGLLSPEIINKITIPSEHTLQLTKQITILGDKEKISFILNSLD